MGYDMRGVAAVPDIAKRVQAIRTQSGFTGSSRPITDRPHADGRDG